MSQTTPGWYPDPSGRFAQRYHDGGGWTDHVVDSSGTQSSDPVPPAGGPAAPQAPSAPQAPFGGGPSSPPPGAPPAGFGQQQPYGQQQYGQQQPYGQQPPPGYGAPQAPFGGGSGFATAPSSGFQLTIGFIAGAVGLLLVLFSVFAGNFFSNGGFDITLGDVSDITGAGGDVGFFLDSYAGWARFLAAVVAVAAFVVAGLDSLPAIGDAVRKNPVIKLGVGIALIVFAVWHLLAMFEEFGDTAFTAWLGLIGFGAIGFGFLPLPQVKQKLG